MARDNAHGGYRRIAGELAGLGIHLAPSTVWEILKRHGLEPAPRREGPGWAGFLRSQAEAIVERWIGTCRRELLDRTLIWNVAHLRRILSEYERHYNEHRPHRTLASAAPLTPLVAPVTDLDDFRGRRHDRIGGVIHEYQQAA
jgi:Integrase core domain